MPSGIEKRIYLSAARLIRKYGFIYNACHRLMEQAIAKLGLAARAYDRILKGTRTIADVEGSVRIVSTHTSETNLRILLCPSFISPRSRNVNSLVAAQT